MNIALIAQAGVFGSLHRLARQWLAPRHPQSVATPVVGLPQTAPRFVAPHAHSSRAIPQNGPLFQPLRVIRVVEAGQARSSSGRMVISGRMADVCAELDRLVAREAALP